MNNVLDEAEIVHMQRAGGYKEPFHRVIQYNCKGRKCLDSLENILSVQLNFENDISGKTLSKKIAVGKKNV